MAATTPCKVVSEHLRPYPELLQDLQGFIHTSINRPTVAARLPFIMDVARREQHETEMATMRRSRLSAHNLRIHTAAFPKKPYFPINRIREMSRPEDEVNDDQTAVDHLGFSYDGLSPQDINMEVRRQASMDALGLYSGNVASLSTPMDRLIARQVGSGPEEMYGRTRDVELLDASELASELSEDAQADDLVSVGSGSLQASSDTLSVSREHFVQSAREQKEQATRNWRRLRMRRRNTMDKMKALRRTHRAGPAVQASRV
ncbi:hypothetical protein P171DRAFT_123978 [Karstenula rhodostoma CBS 690.94]|uniref:Uncharacterized protein n=1 Tax=Karstenula rhodostoma CBS 690.94 TaxID=1392251 RepID=A0A9P4P8N9_9PLEO|nr:hypothetical protein P171DRAFT_123978 [Karstenula rhodostoma CBS 690.94]